MTEKNILAYKLFLSLNILDFNLFLCENCNPPLKKVIPLFPSNPPLKFGWRLNPLPPPLHYETSEFYLYLKQTSIENK